MNAGGDKEGRESVQKRRGTPVIGASMRNIDEGRNSGDLIGP